MNEEPSKMDDTAAEIVRLKTELAEAVALARNLQERVSLLETVIGAVANLAIPRYADLKGRITTAVGNAGSAKLGEKGNAESYLLSALNLG